jgi:hypothetical protein
MANRAGSRCNDEEEIASRMKETGITSHDEEDGMTSAWKHLASHLAVRNSA